MNKCTRCGENNPAEIHTCTPQSKAQRLADRLENAHSVRDSDEAAAELRRLDALVGELVEALEEVRSDVQRMIKGHFVHLPTVDEELEIALAKAKEQT